MILQIGEDVSRIAIRTKSWRNQRFVRDWENLYLIIEPGQGHDHCHDCGDGGSPWFAWGCWPMHRTGVDLMNPPRPDFPAFIIKAEALTDDATIIFTLPDRWKEIVPFGRYNGKLRYQPLNMTVPVNALHWLGEWHMPHPDDCACNQPPHPPMLLPPPPPACDIVHFDIDYGPLCHQHFIDRIDVEFDNDV